jgi:hypothetical protein
MGKGVERNPSWFHFMTFRPPLASRDTFVSSKIVLKVVFLERDFERDHLAEKSNRTKMGQKIHCAMGKPKYTQTLGVT